MKPSFSFASLVSVLIALVAFSACTRAVPRHVVVAVYRRSFNENKPQYLLYLRGAVLDELRFEQPQLIHRIDNISNRCDLYGTGFINWESNKIQIDDGAVRVNGGQLPKVAFNSFVITASGAVTNGYIASAK